MEINQEQVEEIREKILSFYEEHGRTLPWRETTDPYKVWVSEVMLQQTQVSRVIPKYRAWIDKYSSVKELAKASFPDVLRHWQGLGYNNRAKWLHEAAQQIVHEFNGDLPRGEHELQELQGVGPYTARAIKIFAFNDDVVTVDTNIRRVLIHELDLSEDLEENDLYDVARRLLPEGQSREWHNALMDYGALKATSTTTGISPTTTQSSFEGSVRQVRGEILRRLQDSPLSVADMESEYPERADRAIEGLQEDGLIDILDGRITLDG